MRHQYKNSRNRYLHHNISVALFAQYFPRCFKFFNSAVIGNIQGRDKDEVDSNPTAHHLDKVTLLPAVNYFT